MNVTFSTRTHRLPAHPCIVTVYGVCLPTQMRSGLWLVMELLEAGSLLRVLRDDVVAGELGFVQLLDIAQSVVSGMLHLHNNGVVSAHADLSCVIAVSTRVCRCIAIWRRAMCCSARATKLDTTLRRCACVRACVWCARAHACISCRFPGHRLWLVAESCWRLRARRRH
jgi:hypothetical protein